MNAYYNNSFIKLFNQISKLKKAPYKRSSLCFDIQSTLINKIRYIEKKLKYWKAKARNDSNKDKLKIFTRKREEYRNILHLFKIIGDCLAYIYISRWDIKPLSFNSAPGFITDKKGFQLEYRIFRYVAKKGVPCLLADLTNTLRHGDLYVFKEDALPLILEVKTSKKIDRRARRQKRRLKILTDYLLKDKTSKFFSKKITAIRVAPKEPDYYHLDSLNKVIQEAYKKGHIVKQIENELYYVVDTLCKPNIMEKVIENCSTPFVFFINQGKFNKSSYPYYPIILSMISSKAILDYFHDRLLILVIVDLDIVYNHFKSKGINYNLSSENEYIFDLWIGEYADWRAKGFDMPLRVSKNFWGKIGYEFLSLEWIYKYISEKATSIPKELTDLNGV